MTSHKTYEKKEDKMKDSKDNLMGVIISIMYVTYRIFIKRYKLKSFLTFNTTFRIISLRLQTNKTKDHVSLKKSS